MFANKPEYERLRETTSHTTIEVADQARDYISEFYRLRRCILPRVTIPFVYECDHACCPRSVLLVGDFTEWEEHPIAMTKKESWRFESNLPLSPGNYHFKCLFKCLMMCRFIVDGSWTTTHSIPTFRDDCGNNNHIVTVPESTNESVNRIISNLYRVWFNTRNAVLQSGFFFHFSLMDATTKVDINVKILLIGDSNVGKSW